MIRIRIIRFITLLFVSIFITGCATIYNPATGRDELIWISTRAETEIGKASAAQVAKKYKISDDRAARERLNRIGQRLAEVSDRQDLEYSFYLIKNKDLNAFTIPGAHVYIFTGLYDMLSDDELASVLAHEIGHVAARHAVKKLQASMGYQLLSTAALLTYTRKKDEREKNAARIAYAAATAFNLVMLGYSRDDEYQADSLAVKYARKAGFDPKGMIGALRKLENKKKKGLPAPYILRSHPYIKERIKHLEAELRGTGPMLTEKELLK